MQLGRDFWTLPGLLGWLAWFSSAGRVYKASVKPPSLRRQKISQVPKRSSWEDLARGGWETSRRVFESWESGSAHQPCPAPPWAPWPGQFLNSLLGLVLSPYVERDEQGPISEAWDVDQGLITKLKEQYRKERKGKKGAKSKSVLSRHHCLPLPSSPPLSTAWVWTILSNNQKNLNQEQTSSSFSSSSPTLAAPSSYVLHSA